MNKSEVQSRCQTAFVVFFVLSAYISTGYLGLLLAVPPGYATAIWAPSGIALAATLICGFKALPGIFFGSFLLNFYISSLTSNIWLSELNFYAAVGIGTGAMLQAVVGFWLVKQFVGLNNPLYYPKPILLFALLTGPISCLVATTIGNATLFRLGILSTDNFATSWLTWWIGDAIGVLIFTPVVLILFGKPSSVWHSRIVPVLFPLCVAFMIVLMAHVYYSHAEYNRVENKFRLVTKSHAFELSTSLQNKPSLTLETLYQRQTSASEQPGKTGVLEKILTNAFANFSNYSFLSLQPKVSANSHAKAMILHQQPSVNHHDQFSIQFPVILNQKKWLLRAVSTPNYIVQEYSWEVWTSLSATLFFCVLINIILMILYGQRFLIQFLAEKQANELQMERNKNQLLLNKAEQGVILLDAETLLTHVNPAACQLLGYERAHLIGQPLSLLLTDTLLDKHSCPIDGAPLYQAIFSKQMIKITKATFYQANGGRIWVDYICMPVVISGMMDGVMILFSDVTERLHTENELINLAHYDTLTQLPNRFSFCNYLEQVLERAALHHILVGVCFIDIDNFKFVNDTYGHATGDALLQQIAPTMKPHLRSTDYLARISGDEFALILQDVKDKTQLTQILNRMIDAFKQPIHINGDHIQTTVSIGVALFPEDGMQSNQLINKADKAMYQAKDKGKAGYILYS